MRARALLEITDDPLCCAARLGDPLFLYQDRKDGFRGISSLSYRLQPEPCSNQRIGSNRRRKPDPIQTVIDRHPHPPNFHRLLQEVAEQRERQEPVRYSCSKGRLVPGAFNVRVNPLPVARAFRKLLNVFLRDAYPVGHGNFLLDPGFDRIRSLEDQRHGLVRRFLLSFHIRPVLFAKLPLQKRARAWGRASRNSTDFGHL